MATPAETKTPPLFSCTSQALGFIQHPRPVQLPVYIPAAPTMLELKRILDAKRVPELDNIVFPVDAFSHGILSSILAKLKG